MEIREIDRESYDNFLERLPSPFLQKSAMGEVLKSNGRKIKLLGLFEGEDLYAVGLAFYRKINGGERMDLMVGARGLEEKYEYLFYDKLRDFVKGTDVLKLVIKLDQDYMIYDQRGEGGEKISDDFFEKMKNAGYIENDGSILSEDGSPDRQFIKNLEDFYPDDYQGLLKSFNKNAQRQIKKAKELGLTVLPIDFSDLETFKEITGETAQRQGFGDKALAYYETFYREFGEDCEFLSARIDFDKSISLIEGEIEKTGTSSKNKERRASLEKDLEMLEGFKKEAGSQIVDLANMILVYEKDQAIYFLGGSLTKYQKLPAPFLLQYEAMIRAMKRGKKLYNFYGVDGEFDGSDGVLRFKQNFNGQVLRKTGAFIYYPDPKKYQRIQKLKEIKRKFKN